jgi:hypothetical protein
MLITIVGDVVHVRLSRRNLRQLGAMLDNPERRDICLARRAENGASLVVQVEEDADHYQDCDSSQLFEARSCF